MKKSQGVRPKVLSRQEGKEEMLARNRPGKKKSRRRLFWCIIYNLFVCVRQQAYLCILTWHKLNILIWHKVKYFDMAQVIKNNKCVCSYFKFNQKNIFFEEKKKWDSQDSILAA